MLAFDPSDRITVVEALEHPWLAAYHDESDEPVCPEPFTKWREIEELETLEDFRDALWSEIEDYRREVRGIHLNISDLSLHPSPLDLEPFPKTKNSQKSSRIVDGRTLDGNMETVLENQTEKNDQEEAKAENLRVRYTSSPERFVHRASTSTPNDPLVTYARRSSIMQPSRQGSTYNSPLPSTQHVPAYAETSRYTESGAHGPGSIAFPSQGYVVPARSRTGSMAGGGGDYTRKLLRTLSTVSIHESAEGLVGGLAGIAPIGKFIAENKTEEADAPPSEMPRDFGISEKEDNHQEKSLPIVEGSGRRKEGKFQL